MGLQKLIDAMQNLRNWHVYTFQKEQRNKRDLFFVTKPYPVTIRVDKSNYPVFKELFVEDFYEFEKVIKQLPPSPTIVDIGANVGFFVALVMSKIINAKVYAIDPLPKNAKSIKELISTNNLQSKVVVSELALTDKDNETIDLYIEEDDQTSISSIYSDFHQLNKQKISVSTSRLDTYMDKHSIQNIDLLKVDCEGAEYVIFYNMKDEYFKKIKMILLEVHEMDNADKNARSMEKFLKEKGFNVTSQPFKNDCYYLFATNTRA